MNETNLYVDLSPQDTYRQATLNLFFFLKQNCELIRYQTKLLQYHLVFQNLYNHDLLLEIFLHHP